MSYFVLAAPIHAPSPIPRTASRPPRRARYPYSEAFPQGQSPHARIAPLSLLGSMLSETPGRRKSLSSIVSLHMACAQVNAISPFPNFPVLGAMCQIQGLHPSPRRTPTACSGSGRLDLPYPGRLLLRVLHPSFLLNDGSLPG